MIEFTCRPEILDIEWSGPDRSPPNRREPWLEVGCVHDGEMWHCGHHHRKVGPLLRCMTRHIQTIEEEKA